MAAFRKKQAWDCRLGNRSALEWILDQHKEKTPRARRSARKFNTYRFADHKEKVIELLKRRDAGQRRDDRDRLGDARSARDAR